jgi:Uncharacterized protein conserved in bacteria (DUF2087)
MNVAELTKKLQQLAVKHDVWPSSVDESTLGAMLFDAAQSIPADGDVTERVATEALHAWIGGNGSMLRYDAVELRRLLVDWQFITRDGFGRAYRRAATPPARFAEVCAVAASIDFTPLIAAARSRDAEIRAARKASYLSRLAA